MASDIDTLVDMGFSRVKVQKAWKATNGAGLQPAMDWLLAHPEVSDEPDEDTAPQALGSSSSSNPSQPTSEAPKESEEGEIKEGEQTAQSLVCNDCGKLFRDAATAERHAIKTSHQNFSESTQAIAPLTEEEKQAKLAELKARLAEKRAAKAREEAEERRQSEKIRRKTGQEISVARQQMEEKEMKKAMEAKRREKEADKLAKAKIKAQIEQDKKERQAKREAAKLAAQEQKEQQAAAASSSSSAAAAAPAAKKEYNEARLQFRVPGIAPITQTFPADTTLQQVHEFLQSKGCNQPFALSMTFPRKTFGGDDLDKTLKELNLVPSSALILNYN
ncbi:hypothetical protein O0I10_012468 [Lichtheimia ornata]|uniref:Uncharacterized protein n=1 Tax=Lichtheimia ornata TaxID=688661 RepID=A0AAD7UR54_9FUNG|nr:uncharacterized protein O0I10_012468 [Lichtheimia ornata]KAJ8651948.1 hypothetical protein O0I10_012468 [Lichtheimia ornata]